MILWDVYFGEGLGDDIWEGNEEVGDVGVGGVSRVVIIVSKVKFGGKMIDFIEIWWVGSGVFRKY